MPEFGLLVIGSGPAGVSAAASFREHDSDSRVQIFTADADVPYERPPLSKEYLRGETDDVTLHSADWFTDRAIELNLDCAVERLDLAERTVHINGRRHPFNTLVLACGVSPQPPPIPGGHRALLLRSLADATALRTAAHGADSAVVIGSGFIGCEAAASLARCNVAVTLVAPEPLPQERRLGADAATRLRDLVSDTGARHAGGVGVVEIFEAGVRLDNGVTIDCDLVLAATGVTPRSALAADAGLNIRDARVVVGSDMATSAEGVYAAGDLALARHTVAGRHLAVEHWQDATDQGAIAGAAAAGEQPKWDAVPGFWTTIGEATLKYHAWGDGFERSRLIDHPDGFTVWYESGGATAGVLTFNRDDDYDLGERLISESRPAPVRTW
ncbi:NAD(P)/FAD-dependent oxidoreductase [Mycobacterium vicinigordonae]|uniref:NAD(P)/FAD-dependent oxidoreductase n=1 Tax=Mycobacterium vicinigordonae TaxID=1719132 RepID=UPI001FE2DE18|nr:FAD-dependent oxidoreductase [Mycobacterium vicinigordonae]